MKKKPLNTATEVNRFLNNSTVGQKRSVGNNLFIVKNAKGGVWKLQCSKVNSVGKKERTTITLGVFENKPHSVDTQTLKPNRFNKLTLKQAREFAYKVKLDFANNTDPTKPTSKEISFLNIKDKWVNVSKALWTDKHLNEIERILSRYVYPTLGKSPINNLTSGGFESILQPLYDDGKYETLKKVRGWCTNICDIAVSEDYLEHNPMYKLKNKFKSLKSRKHFNAISSIDELPALIKAIEESNADHSTKSCLFFIMYTFQRTTETRLAKWNEINLQKSIWTIPNERMKSSFRDFAEGKDHIVPLSKQAVKILKNQKNITSQRNEYIFASYRQKYSKPISSGTMLGLLKKIGYNKKMTVHGFRHLASTSLHEKFPEKTLVIEKQLSHADTNSIRGVYNNSEYMDLRVELMQTWADMIDGAIKTSAMPIC